MRHNAKRGFTIVELVVVIAVIAILAAVLIPTFSSLIKKANLSSDKQAVREMNLALAADEAAHGKPSDIETVMQVLANAGYNSQNWVCLTQGYEVYWWQEENRCVLYNASEAQVEYPTEYKPDVMTKAENHFFVYNENNQKAINMDISLSSGNASSYSTVNSSGNATSIADLASASAGANAANYSNSEKEALSTVSGLLASGTTSSNAELRSALGLDAGETAYVYASREVKSGTANATSYASMQILSVGSELHSSGETDGNLYYISATVSDTATAAQKAEVAKSVGDYVYTIFTQINAAKIQNSLSNPVSIVVSEGLELDVSGHEWAPPKTFCGYFGSSNPDKPVVINGAKLTSNTGYASTVSFTGSASKYFVTGFFGTIYGETTIENVVFKNITFTDPAMDYALTNADQASGKVNSRNCIGIIGGITDNGEKDNCPANVLLKNIKVESSVKMVAGATAGGLIGYIGGAGDGCSVSGNITIEGCEISAELTSNYIPISQSYGPMGGVIGLMCRADKVNVLVKDTKCNGVINGHTNIAALVGDHITGHLTVGTGVDLSGARLNTNALTNNARVAGIVAYSSANSFKTTATVSLTIDGSVTYNTSFAAIVVGTSASAKQYNADKTLK